MRAVSVAGIGIAGASAVAAIAYGQMNAAPPGSMPSSYAIADASGNLHVPDAYRTTYESLGSWAVAADGDKGSKELHVVYASPGTIAAYRKDGHFSDGAVLVKEVFHTATQEMTTGVVSRAGTLKGWFVMMKDSQGRYPNNKLWGNGWGWSWFDAADPTKTTSTDFRSNCLPCHVPARASDWVYVGGYPALSR
jgi:hypothetical protein